MSNKNNAVNVVPAEGEDAQPVEIIEQSIVEIAQAMKKINSTRLTRRAIVTLIHANSRVNKGDIEIVLNNLDELERTWLKKAG